VNFDEYQERAHSTAIYPDEIAEAYLALKLNGEASEALLTLLTIKTGQISEIIGKHYRDDDGLREELTSERKAALVKELGDVLWYLANLAYELNTSLDYIAEQNIKKLASRRERGVLKGSGSDR
jgi:NTP pyrophosphatase (non-canonical NTP hydrolase)